MKNITLILIVDGKKENQIEGYVDSYKDGEKFDSDTIVQWNYGWRYGQRCYSNREMLKDMDVSHPSEFEMSGMYRGLMIIADKLFPDKSYEIRTQVDRS